MHPQIVDALGYRKRGSSSKWCYCMNTNIFFFVSNNTQNIELTYSHQGALAVPIRNKQADAHYSYTHKQPIIFSIPNSDQLHYRVLLNELASTPPTGGQDYTNYNTVMDFVKLAMQKHRLATPQIMSR